MLDSLTNEVAKVVIEVIVSLLGIGGLLVLHKVQQYVAVLKQKDHLGIVDTLVQGAIHVAEAEFKGAKGIEKRNYVVDLVKNQLAGRGIKIDTSEIISAIEKGVADTNKHRFIEGTALEFTPLAPPDDKQA